MPFETFDLYTAGFCVFKGHIPKCVPMPGNRYKFVFTDDARAAAEEFERTEFAPYGDACRRLKRLMFAAPTHDTKESIDR
jgi:hypothetical protein